MQNALRLGIALYLIASIPISYSRADTFRAVSKATTKVEITANLDAEENYSGTIPPIPLALIPSGSTRFTFDSLYEESTFSTVVEVRDRAGMPHEIQICFFKSGLREWTVRSYADSQEVSHPVRDYPRHLTLLPTQRSGTLKLKFNEDGSLNNRSEDSLRVLIPWKGQWIPSMLTLSFKHSTNYAGIYFVSEIVAYPR